MQTFGEVSIKPSFWSRLKSAWRVLTSPHYVDQKTSFEAVRERLIIDLNEFGHLPIVARILERYLSYLYTCPHCQPQQAFEKLQTDGYLLMLVTENGRSHRMYGRHPSEPTLEPHVHRSTEGTAEQG